MNQHQISHATKYNRYPDIFTSCKNYFNKDNIKILSFGCSDGSEVRTLKDLYFKKSYIHGVDIDEKMIEYCNDNNIFDDVKFTLSNDINDEYDLIFCMSVLCRWPQTQNIDDCSDEYNFIDFDKQLIELNKHVKQNGLLVIYNSNFCFYESSIFNEYKPLFCNTKDSGFVQKFNSKNKKIQNTYKDCIFIKK